jgi:transglutaminase superfamily protein
VRRPGGALSGRPVIARMRLAGEILATYARVARSLRRAGLRPTVAALRAPGPALDVSAAERRRAGLALGRAVGRTLAHAPGDTRCLTRSVVLSVLLSRRSVPSRLVIGARVAPRFAAHAWVEIDGRPVLPDGDGEYGRLIEL